MSNGYQIKDQYARYFLTFTVTNWIDIFTRKIYNQILLESLQYCQQNKGLVVYAYVIMSNHIHLIARSEPGKLSNTIRDFKRHTATQIIKAIQSPEESRKAWMLYAFHKAADTSSRKGQYKLWQHHNHPIILHSPDFVVQRCHYIHNNPVKAGLVARASDWQYSSAANYEGRLGLLEVTLLEEMYFI